MVEKKQNKLLLQKQHFYCSPEMSRSNVFPKKWFWRGINIFVKFVKELTVSSVHKRALSPF